MPLHEPDDPPRQVGAGALRAAHEKDTVTCLGSHGEDQLAEVSILGQQDPLFLSGNPAHGKVRRSRTGLHDGHDIVTGSAQLDDDPEVTALVGEELHER